MCDASYTDFKNLIYVSSIQFWSQLWVTC